MFHIRICNFSSWIQSTEIDESKSGSSERFQREAWKGVHGRGKSSWWKTHVTREDRDVKEAIAIKKEDRQLQSGTRDLQVQEGKLDLPRGPQSSLYFNLPDAVPATVSESSVESFLKGVRNRIKMKEEKREPLKVEKENKGDVKAEEEDEKTE